MKKKILIITGIIFCILVIARLITSYIDSARVRAGIEPKYTIKVSDANDSKITYWGLGYKVIRYVSVSLNEPYANNRGVKYGSWFMKYELDSKKDNKITTEDSYFYGKVVEANRTAIIVEPNNDEEIRKSVAQITVELDRHMIYVLDIVGTNVVGTNVKITYDGAITKSSQAQIKVTNIEFIPTENFEIFFKAGEQIDSYNKVYIILDKSEIDKYDYAIYAYDGIVNIRIDNKDYSFKQALIENKITMEEILIKAIQDEKYGKVKTERYYDGGSIEYHYENYTIIKLNTLNGNKDVYIGPKNLQLSDVI